MDCEWKRRSNDDADDDDDVDGDGERKVKRHTRVSNITTMMCSTKGMKLRDVPKTKEEKIGYLLLVYYFTLSLGLPLFEHIMHWFCFYPSGWKFDVHISFLRSFIDINVMEYSIQFMLFREKDDDYMKTTWGFMGNNRRREIANRLNRAKVQVNACARKITIKQTRMVWQTKRERQEKKGR